MDETGHPPSNRNDVLDVLPGLVWKGICTLASVLLRLTPLAFVALAVVSFIWGVNNRQPLGFVSLPMILFGLATLVVNELRSRGDENSIFSVARVAFTERRRRFVTVYLVIELAIGALTIHFSHAISADWGFLAAVVLVFINGALIAYWLQTAAAPNPPPQPGPTESPGRR